MLRRWRDLPPELKIPEVKHIYRRLYRKRGSLLLKRGFDIIASVLLLLILGPVTYHPVRKEIPDLQVPDHGGRSRTKGNPGNGGGGSPDHEGGKEDPCEAAG